MKAFAAESVDDNLSLNAVNIRNKSKHFNRGAFNRGRGNYRAQPNRKNFIKSRYSKNSMSSNKFCRICNLAGSDPNVYLSHEIGDCGRLSQRDLESIKGALVLNGLISIPDDVCSQNNPSYSPQPGWDDFEVDQCQEYETQE